MIDPVRFSTPFDPYTIEDFGEWLSCVLTGSRMADWANGDGYNHRDEQHYDWAFSRAIDIWSNDPSIPQPPGRATIPTRGLDDLRWWAVGVVREKEATGWPGLQHAGQAAANAEGRSSPGTCAVDSLDLGSPRTTRAA